MSSTASKQSIVIQEIMEGVNAMDVDPAAKQKFLQLVGAIGSAHGFDWIERANRIALARDLLRLRVARPLVRDRLMTLFDISQPQAYRIISHALQLSHD
jgi:hypothetical protein